MKEKNGFTQLEFSDLKSHNANPWGLVYAGAVAENQEGKVNIRTINYLLNGLKIAANVYTPAGYDAGKRYPALVVAHPNGGVKEQVAGLYAQRMAEGMHLIDSPLLVMAGAKADTFYMSEQCFSRAEGTKNKELFLIEGAAHIQTYHVPEYVDKAVDKLTNFFNDKL